MKVNIKYQSNKKHKKITQTGKTSTDSRRDGHGRISAAGGHSDEETPHRRRI